MKARVWWLVATAGLTQQVNRETARDVDRSEVLYRLDHEPGTGDFASEFGSRDLVVATGQIVTGVSRRFGRTELFELAQKARGEQARLFHQPVHGRLIDVLHVPEYKLDLGGRLHPLVIAGFREVVEERLRLFDRELFVLARDGGRDDVAVPHDHDEAAPLLDPGGGEGFTIHEFNASSNDPIGEEEHLDLFVVRFLLLRGIGSEKLVREDVTAAGLELVVDVLEVQCRHLSLRDVVVQALRVEDIHRLGVTVGRDITMREARRESVLPQHLRAVAQELIIMINGREGDTGDGRDELGEACRSAAELHNYFLMIASRRSVVNHFLDDPIRLLDVEVLMRHELDVRLRINDAAIRRTLTLGHGHSPAGCL